MCNVPDLSLNASFLSTHAKINDESEFPMQRMALLKDSIKDEREDTLQMCFVQETSFPYIDTVHCKDAETVMMCETHGFVLALLIRYKNN
jgi:hypothetical protein